MADLEGLLDNIKNALDKLVTLEIITAVGPVTLKTREGSPAGSFPDVIECSQKMEIMLTRIDLLQGDIKTVFDPAFFTENYKGLRDFHMEREKQGQAIIKNNVEALKELFNWVKELAREPQQKPPQS